MLRATSRKVLEQQFRFINVAIVGAGTAGCASALFLSKKHNVNVFERVEHPNSIGAGLLLQPTGMYALSKIGLLNEIKQKGTPIHELFAETSTNRTLFKLEYKKLHKDIHGLGIHRGELFQHLYNQVIRQNIKVHTGTDIKSIETVNEKEFLITDKGKHGPYDIIVVCDGARSHICKTYPPLSSLRKRHRKYKWSTLWFLAKDPDNRYGHVLHQSVQGTTKMLGILPNGYHDGERVVSMFWSIPADMKQTWRELNLEELKHEILTIAPHAEPLIRQLHTIDQLTFADYFDTVMEKPYAGRVVALGDAYHSMSPQLGNGANLALWDAMQLSEAIDKHLNLDQALEAFANERRPHVWFYGFASRMLTPYFQSYSRVLGWGRDMFMGIFSAIPFFNKLMVIVLCGIRRGMFKRYDIDQLAKTFAKKP